MIIAFVEKILVNFILSNSSKIFEQCKRKLVQKWDSLGEEVKYACTYLKEVNLNESSVKISRKVLMH